MTSENPNFLAKQKAVQQLQKTITQLENIVQKLDRTSTADLPSSSTIETLIKTTTELEEFIAQTETVQNQQSIQTESTPLINSSINPEKPTIIIEPNTAKEDSIPQNVELPKSNNTSEDIAPKSVKNNQSKPQNRKNILIAVAIILLTLIPISWKLFIANRQPVLIAQDPLQTIAETETIPNETEPKAVKPEESIADSTSTELLPINSEASAEPDSKIPPTIVADKKPKKVTVKSVKIAKNLTPDQSLIAAIESKEQELINNYVNDLIVSIEPNFENNIVTIFVTDDWYNLEAKEQNKVTEEILKKVWQLNFNKLKVFDSRSTLVARNPVVGKNIVILKRTM